MRRLADGAEHVRRRIKTRVEIPDFTQRHDEIGHLSGALRDMVQNHLMQLLTVVGMEVPTSFEASENQFLKAENEAIKAARPTVTTGGSSGGRLADMSPAIEASLCRQLGLRDASALASSALLRGCYHLYQGVGGGLGNVVMGLVFGRFYQRTRRLWPLVIAHAVIDVVPFVGFLLVGDRLGISEIRK